MLARLALVLVMASGGTALAQEDLDDPDAPETGRAPITPPMDAAEQVADESVYVIQRRAYSKKGQLEVTPLVYTSLNNKFVIHAGPGVSLAYHLRENLTLELLSSIPVVMYSEYSGLVYELYEKESLAPEVVDLKQMTYFGAASLQFSALYGKLEFYGFLLDYDFYATAGIGIAATQESCPNPGSGACGDDVGIGRGLQTPAESGDKFKVAGSLGGGARFFFEDWIGLRVEVRDLVYSDRATESLQTYTDIRNNVLFIVGVSFLL